MAGAAHIDAHHGIVVGYPLLGIDHLPVGIFAARASRHLGVLADQPIPRIGCTFLESEAFGIRPGTEKRRVTAVALGAKYVAAQDDAVVHRDGRVPVDSHPVPDLAPGCDRGLGLRRIVRAAIEAGCAHVAFTSRRGQGAP